MYWLTQMFALYPDSLTGLYEKSKRICDELIETIQKQRSSFQRHAHATSLLCGLAGQVLAVWHYLQRFQPEHIFVQDCLDIFWELCMHSIATESPLGLYTGVCGAGVFLLDLMTGTSMVALPFLVAGPANGKIMERNKNALNKKIVVLRQLCSALRKIGFADCCFLTKTWRAPGASP